MHLLSIFPFIRARVLEEPQNLFINKAVPIFKQNNFFKASKLLTQAGGA